MTIKALIFDFDGTILDTEGPAFESWRRIYQAYGHELDIGVWHVNVGAVDLFDMVADLERRVGHPLDRAEVLRRRQAEKDVLSADMQVMPGVHALLDAADAAGLKLGLASSSDRAWIERWLAVHGLRERFSCVRTRDDVARPKPAPDLYRSAAECLGVAPANCLALEDSPNGLRAALDAGIRCVVVPNPITAPLVFEGAALRLTSLAELTLPELLERLAISPDTPAVGAGEAPAG